MFLAGFGSWLTVRPGGWPDNVVEGQRFCTQIYSLETVRSSFSSSFKLDNIPPGRVPCGLVFADPANVSTLPQEQGFFCGRADPSLWELFWEEAVPPPWVAIPEFPPHSSASVKIRAAVRGLRQVCGVGPERDKSFHCVRTGAEAWLVQKNQRWFFTWCYCHQVPRRARWGGFRARLWVYTSGMWHWVSYLSSLSLIHVMYSVGPRRVVLRWEIINERCLGQHSYSDGS